MKKKSALEISDEIGVDGQFNYTFSNEEVLNSCKTQLKLHIDTLLEQGMRKANLEIELIHYIKKLLYAD